MTRMISVLRLTILPFYVPKCIPSLTRCSMVFMVEQKYITLGWAFIIRRRQLHSLAPFIISITVRFRKLTQAGIHWAVFVPAIWYCRFQPRMAIVRNGRRELL